MSWSRVFKSQCYNQLTLKYKDLPIYQTKEFDFFRCIEFQNSFYGKTVSELFNNNLRESSGRYSKLFPNQKISYWADSPQTARAEIKKHGAGNSILTFRAYDDLSSFIPCLGGNEHLIIVDGRKCGIQDLIDKIDKNIELSDEEQSLIKKILKCDIDCIAFDSKTYPGGENFIFLEKGFKKLALKELRLRFARDEGGAHDYICCAVSSDYKPCLEEYGKCFMPKCRIKMNKDYLKSKEYIERCNNVNDVWDRKFGRNRY